jgi:phosphatidylglycerophosphate synthase
MALHQLKYPYRKVLLPIAKKMKFINPDIFSYAAVGVAFFTMICYLDGAKDPSLLLWSLFLTFVRMTFNTLDGIIAIERGDMTIKGEIMNALPDRYADIFIISGIALSPLCSPVLGIIGLASMFLVSYSGMLGKALGMDWQHQGPLDKVERFFYIMVFVLLQYLHIKNIIPALHIAGFNLTYFEWCMIVFLILGQITVYNRVKGQLKQADEMGLKARERDINS